MSWTSLEILFHKGGFLTGHHSDIPTGIGSLSGNQNWSDSSGNSPTTSIVSRWTYKKKVNVRSHRTSDDNRHEHCWIRHILVKQTVMEDFLPDCIFSKYHRTGERHWIKLCEWVFRLWVCMFIWTFDKTYFPPFPFFKKIKISSSYFISPHFTVNSLPWNGVCWSGGNVYSKSGFFWNVRRQLN